MAQGEALKARPRQRRVVVVVGSGCGQGGGPVSFNIEAVGCNVEPRVRVPARHR